MPKGTTVELDEELLAKAKRLLALRATRETIQEPLRRVVAEEEARESARAQTVYLAGLKRLVDLEVLRSDAMWR
jgi:Arc/MetJ family transcription regulator